MCGRFQQQRPTSELARIFEAEDLVDDPGGRFNVAPTDPAVVVVQRDDRRALARYGWGLVRGSPAPGGHGPGAPGGRPPRPFNARAETVATSPLFREPLRRRRCLVPVDGFYEWLRQDGRRQPVRIHHPEERPLALAGIWTGHRDPEDGEWRRTFAIITTAANDFMAPIHHRMPVILRSPDWERWLEPALQDPGELLALLRTPADLALAAYPVPSLVNDVRNDGPALVERLQPPGPAATLR